MGRDDFQLSEDAAEVYEAQFVPALFARWAPHTVRAGGVRPGQSVLDVIGSYWRLGDLAGLRDSLAAAGLRAVDTLTRTDTAAFPSVDGFVPTEVGGTPLRSRLTDEAYARILEGARDVLDPYRTDDGSLEPPIRGHVVSARPEPRTSGRDPGGTPVTPVRRGGPAAG